MPGIDDPVAGQFTSADTKDNGEQSLRRTWAGNSDDGDALQRDTTNASTIHARAEGSAQVGVAVVRVAGLVRREGMWWQSAMFTRFTRFSGSLRKTAQRVLCSVLRTVGGHE